MQKIDNDTAIHIKYFAKYQEFYVLTQNIWNIKIKV